jgi:hypothetical protein
LTLEDKRRTSLALLLYNISSKELRNFLVFVISWRTSK